MNEAGEFVAATVLKVEKNSVHQVKTQEKDGVSAVVIASKAIPSAKKSYLKQFMLKEGESFEKGAEMELSIMKDISEVNIMSFSKGKGFQGVMKRHNFHGMRATHGSKYRRAPGSIGTRKPRRTKRGQKMPGIMGGDRVTLHSIPVLDIDKKNQLLVVKGPVPGSINALVYVSF